MFVCLFVCLFVCSFVCLFVCLFVQVSCVVCVSFFGDVLFLFVALPSFLEHPSLPKFLPLAQTYCKTRGRHQNMGNVHFFLLRAFFPKPGWSVLQDPPR